MAESPPASAGVPSPCTAVCRIHEPTGWCLGCGRTLAEIAAWSGWGDEAKRAVWRQLPARRVALPDPDGHDQPA